jgi:hypothetical protein
MNKYLEDTAGNKSSKRLWGSIVFTVAIVLSVYAVVASVYLGNSIDSNVFNIIASLSLSGTSLLGIGTFEKGKRDI